MKFLFFALLLLRMPNSKIFDQSYSPLDLIEILTNMVSGSPVVAENNIAAISLSDGNCNLIERLSSEIVVIEIVSDGNVLEEIGEIILNQEHPRLQDRV